MVLDGFNDISLAVCLEDFLGLHGVMVVEGHQEVTQVANALFEGDWVSECSLVVGDGPLGRAHDSQVVVQVGVDAPEESVLGCKARPGDYK